MSDCLSQVSVLLKRRITQTMPHSQGIVFCCRRSRPNSNGVTCNGSAKCRWSR